MAEAGIPHIVLARDTGAQLMVLDHNVVSMSYVKTVNGVGSFSLKTAGWLPTSTLQADRLVMVWLTFPDRNPVLDFVGFLDRWSFSLIDGPYYVTTLSGKDQNSLPDRRIVAYKAASGEARLAAVAVDNGMKDLASLNLGSGATDTDRTFPSFDVDGDRTAGATVTKGFSHRPVERVLTELADWSKVNGPEVFWWVEVTSLDSDGGLNLAFKTATGQPGADRGLTANQRVEFSPGLGNLKNGDITYDWTDVVSHVYVGGPGEEEDREVVTRSDTTRSAVSQYGRKEAFRDARNTPSAGLNDEGDEFLGLHRPRVRISGQTLDSPVARYGLQWGLGTRVVASLAGVESDVVIKKVNVNLAAGKLSVVGHFEGDVT